MAETTEQYRTRISQIKTSIENEPRIVKMRDDIAEGISKTGNRQADIEVRQDTLEDDFVAVQQDASSASPSGAEVAVARAGYNTLNGRLTAKEQEIVAQFTRTGTYFTDVGGVGDGVTDNTEALKEFVSLGGNLVVPEGTYMLRADFYEIASNTKLFFINNATLKLLPHNASNYSILQCKGVDNVLIVKPQIDGSKADNLATSGEWGHGIDILNSTKVKVIHPIVRNTFGDGIYIGHDYFGTSLKETEDVDIIRPLIDGSRRNGLSLCSGRRINVIYPTFKNITDVNPKAGIDIEPEGEGPLKPILEHVLIDSPVFENCTVGIDHNLFNLMDRDLGVDIVIRNPTFINCSHPLMFRPLTGKLGGSISISKPIMRGTLKDVLHVDNYCTRDTPHVTIDRPEIYGFNLSGSQDEFYNHCFTFLKLSTTTDPVDIGNFSIINPYIEDNNNGAFKLLFASAGGVKKIGNVKIVNPEIKTTNLLQNFVRDNPDLQIIDGLDSMVLKDPYFTHDIAQTLATQVTNPDASVWNTYTSTDANIPYGHKVKFRVVKNMRMTFRPTGGIVGYSGANKGIYSETVGSMIELIYLGKWYVENKAGEWLVET
ncbi:hypothetical protein [Carnobacterium jeotgali]|uniref:hypothetical protein n=1 Tax=Carnobacterium jeotgali TaxID=545534 RepID=UPI0004937AEC|nr:hypothetical protein [Carnobacterium jeotgali]